MCAFVETICAKAAGVRDKKLFPKHFQWERQEHLLAVEKGYDPPVSPVHFWKRKTNCEPERTWSLDTLLISGYDVFLLLKKKLDKSLLTVRDGIEEIDFGPVTSERHRTPFCLPPRNPDGVASLRVAEPSGDSKSLKCLWVAYQKLPLEVRIELNAVAYELTAERCRIVKDIELDPPKRVKDPGLLALLSAFTAADTAQLIIAFVVDPYLPNHLRCCASANGTELRSASRPTPGAKRPQRGYGSPTRQSADTAVCRHPSDVRRMSFGCPKDVRGRVYRCPFPRFKRYCPAPLLGGCCNGFKIEPNACLYDVCSFHLLKINQSQNYVLVSCD